MINQLRNIVLRLRLGILLTAHLAVMLTAYLAALLIRFDFAVPLSEWPHFLATLLWYLPVKLLVFYWVGTFRGWWRYVTFADLADLLRASIVSTLVVAAIDYFLIASYQIPRGTLLLDFALTVLLFGGFRASFRLLRECYWPIGKSRDAKRALVVGANRTGEVIVRQTNGNPQSGYRIVGFLDENPAHYGTRLAGVPVLAQPQDAATTAARMQASVVFVTANTLPGPSLRQLMETCRTAGIIVKVVPSVEDIINGRYKMQVRDVDIDDLLRREPASLDTAAIRDVLRGRRVMITGAGGSIGSEICRQVIRYEPESLILVERFESALFFIHRELEALGLESTCYPCIADITDRQRMRELFEQYRPELVFHAAAHKHVPMMECNPGEAIKNNVFGTKCVADLAAVHGVERFVLISTDKAVHPTSIMGVSKQLAERYIHSLPASVETKFVAVRFGNVLGSVGSVVPIFQEQIRRGGPITITHPDMERYFMTIPEASQLVLQAAAMGKGGEIFVLDMGEPVKIVDLAKDMIRLSGLRPEDIEITFSGIRPGEKLYEELRFKDEELLPTTHPKIQVAYHRPFEGPLPSKYLRELRSMLKSDDNLIRKLQNLVPEYRRSKPRAEHSVAAREEAVAARNGKQSAAEIPAASQI